MSVESVHQQSELLVMDYLRGSRCMKTMDALSRWISDKARKSSPKSHSASELFNKDVAARKTQIGRRKQSKSHRMSCVSPDVLACMSVTPTDASLPTWTPEEVAMLKKAVKSTQSITDKTERWKNVSSILGRSKRECYDKYKEIKKDRKSSSKVGDAETPRAKINNVDAPKTKSKGRSSDKKQPLDDDKGSGSTWGSARAASATVAPDRRAASKYEAVVEDDVVDDDIIDDVPSAPVKQALGRPPAVAASVGRSLTSAEVSAMRTLLFGETKKGLTSHWTAQGFPFAPMPGYGIVQHEGGPCGVMAVVQAYTLYFLFQNTTRWQEPRADELRTALTDALTHIVWQASDGSQCTMALPGAQPTIEHVRVSSSSLNSRSAAREFIASHIDEYLAPRGSGVILLVASVLLTRGLTTIAADMDAPDGATPTLVGAHDYCTQELVNLLLVGYACSNVFDGTQDLGDGLTLRGIGRQGLVGFLTLFEAYDYMVVGAFLKAPTSPIWVVCSESHYSVLFANPDAATPPASEQTIVELLYYDGLANQDEPIQLSVSPFGLAAPEKPRHDDNSLTPPLDLVIRTKWPRGTVDWHGTEPLL
ncbi:hypothetical protein SPRG_20176 [Saprolegnia parasitica CBS 223.65]|uniref:Myb-like domain-containing protein n=1 Tax=Saprolegnia parasitica (strain CBS 223.65) TaxID=695850 RepID=A0A067CMF1_SAPPC|nr:hypothetical protein SPRG_20176 [Saprolegnia parasitica CBS 223.65]KDO28012.1 hypothetical protein SPRG_20176 [Saprolegnia parasitica CBS 223.65]|eukprot:XP_012201170.1 hypothetical protein SPRG_20176 [Saprolegnia parasitica CBS 223.65]